MDYIEFHSEVPTNLSTMVMAFGGWIDAGEAATGAMRHLVRHLSAPRLASIDPEAFFIFTQERPEARMTSDGNRAIRWPRSEFYTWQPPGGQPGMLLFRGMEPNQLWRTYSNMFLDLVEQCGVKRIVSIGALLAGSPHTRPTRVTGRSTDPEWQVLMEDWGIYRRPSYQGPTGISTILLEAAHQRGISSLSFMGQAPHYLQVTSNPSVIQALLTHVNRLLGLGLDVSRLDAAVEAFRTKCDQLVANDPSTQSHVQQLEQEYDSESDEEPDALDSEELNSDQLMQDLENFLREEREGES
ncbi:PAC2 family protein [Candidatus Entotheonella palauensis]|nr:PAC2 family protein [Candidatus Entotheonella palauensis]